MSGFGDFTTDDSLDTAEPDPEALARLFLLEQRRLSGDNDRPLLEDLHELERILLIFTFAALIARLKREWKGG